MLNMKLYLFGGAELGPDQGSVLKALINKALLEIKPKQLLYIPFARPVAPEKEKYMWGEGWVTRDLNLEGVELLDARKEEDLAQAVNPAIFIPGGHERDNLYEKIISNKRLYKLVMNAENLIGESSGAMVTAEFRRTYRDGSQITTKGLGILKDTIIEAHYVQRQRQQALRDEMEETGAKYGLGIDSDTGVLIDTVSFPEEYKILGSGLVELIVR